MKFLHTLLAALALVLTGTALAQTGPAPAPTGSDWLGRGSDIPADPAWRLGTLPNGLRYAVRRNALPAGAVSIRIRIDAGALHEADSERGWAHFLEHMLFRGTESFPDRRARQIWQELGASFGSDSNAHTTLNETVYQLDLPRADRASLDTALQVLAEMMTRARIEPAAVAAERAVVIAEKARRPELAERMRELAARQLFAGLRFAERDTIGTDATLNAATAPGLRAFYRRWYRPERATIVLAGDADPAMMAELIRARFGGWRGEGPPPADPDPGRIADVTTDVANLAYPGVPVSGSVAWLRPYAHQADTIAHEQQLLAESLAERIINRRLERHARGTSAYVGASLNSGRMRNIAEITQLTVSARDGRWSEALSESFAILADALRTPPSAEEIGREISNIRTAAAAAVEGEASLRSPGHAERIVGAVGSGSVVATAATAATRRDLLERSVALMTPARIHAAMLALVQGAGPRMILLTPEPVAGGEARLAEALSQARAAAPATRGAERRVSFDDLPPQGSPGREVARERIADMDVTIVRFANGSTLTFKPTQFSRGSVEVRLRFGHGISGLPRDRPSLAWLGGLVGPSGMAGLDLEGMERLMTGRRLGLTFRVEEEAFVLAGQTQASELGDQLRLLTTKITHAEWDPQLFARFRAAAVESFAMHDSSAAARAGREAGGVIRPNDERWRPIERAEMEAVTVERFRNFFTPLLAQGPVHAVIVGDVTLEAAVEAMRRTVAALPARPEAVRTPGSEQLRPPAPNPRPRSFTHSGDPNQAYAMIGWSTFGGEERTRERRALALAANMFEARLFDRMREEEGVTYSPNAAHRSARVFLDWGIFHAEAAIAPDRAEAFFRIARETIADLAARPAAADEFARAQNPVISGIERALATNGYWVDAIETWATDPDEIEPVRTYLADYRSLTPEDVRRAVATHVTDEGDWSMLVLPARGSRGGNS